MSEIRLSIPEMAVAVATLVAATVAATVADTISGDALVALYGSVLGYVFGRARTGVQTANGMGGVRTLARQVAEEALPMVHKAAIDKQQKKENTKHTVPGTRPEK